MSEHQARDAAGTMMAEPETLPAPVRDQVEALYFQAQMLPVWQRVQPFGHPTEWTGVESRMWAGRLAGNLGSHRLARILHRQNFRRHPQNLTAATYWGHTLLEMRGPLAARHFLAAYRAPEATDSPDSAQYYHTLRAMVEESFRDFETAWAQLEKAAQYLPDNPWLKVCRASLLEVEDRYEEALATARSVLVDHPNYRPGIQEYAHLLQVMDRDEEALEVLRAADARTQAAPIVMQLAGLQMELGYLAEARASYDRFLELAPLADHGTRQWINQNRATLACRTGDIPQARAWCHRLLAEARQKEAYYTELQKRLEQPDPPRRRLCLEVPFVRQHHLTCAPATLTALSRYWGHPAEHLELAEAICYDGTPCHSERHWAESNGFVVREFTVTWEAAVALIERGVPFTLTTPESTSSHLQAVVGFDELQQALLIRDPFIYCLREALHPKFLERYAASGPRGMLMVPPAERHRLADLQLPDTQLYDRLHQVYRALEEHQRAKAAAVLAEMQNLVPDHRLTHTASWVIHGYDANTLAIQQDVEALLRLHPKTGHLLLARLGCLWELAGRAEKLAFLEELAGGGAVEPVFLNRLADELRADGRELPRAMALNQRALRRQPTNPEFLKTMADLLWDQRQFESALDFYRLAACAAPLREHYAHSYYIALRHWRKNQQGVDFLRGRYRRLGTKSGRPAITLFEGLVTEDLTAEGFNLLEEARQRCPDDETLRLHHVDALARFGHRQRASELLQQARGTTRHNDWLRSAARLAHYQPDPPQALQYWQEILVTEPLALDANRQVALLLAETREPAAARTFLDETCRRFPRHCGLLRLRAEMLANEPRDISEATLRDLLAANPADGWAVRELAIHFSKAGDYAEALALANRAIALEPGMSAGYSVRGGIHRDARQPELARSDFEQALRLSVDNGFAMQQLVELATTAEQRQTALDFIQTELVRQVVFDDALHAFYHAARGILPPEAVCARFRDALQARPDLWAAWSVMIIQLTDMDRHTDALAYALRACERFPFVPRLWFDRARLHEARAELPQAIEALDHALNIHPGYGQAARYKAELLTKTGQAEVARRCLEIAAAQAPLDAQTQAALAETLWSLDQKEAGLENLQRALRLEPGMGWGWDELRDWAGKMGRPELAVQMVRELTERRPGEARSWMYLAESLAGIDEAESLQAVDHAIQLNPGSAHSHDLKARLLANGNRFDEALQCCQNSGLTPLPPILRMRIAWIEAQRGRLAAAVQQMEAALAEAPANYGGWQLLSEWCAQTGNLERATQAADQMAQLAPMNPVPLGYAADLLERQNKSAEALDRLRRAFQLDPAYTFAGLRLVDTQLRLFDQNSEGDALAHHNSQSHPNERLAEARRVLEVLEAHANSDLVTARKIQVLAREDRLDEAVQLFASLCRESSVRGQWSLLTSAQELMAHGKAAEISSMVRNLLNQFNQPTPTPAIVSPPTPTAGPPEMNPYLGALEVWLGFHHRCHYGWPAHLDALIGHPVLGRNALSHYFDLAADAFCGTPRPDVWMARRAARDIADMVRRHQAMLCADNLLWGKAGYALVSVGNYPAAVAWLADWQSRTAVEPWMLCNLAIALGVMRRWEAGLQVVQKAMSLRQSPELLASLCVYGATFAVLLGQTEAARIFLSQQPPGELNASEKALHELIEVALSLPAGRVGANRWKISWQIMDRLKAGLNQKPLFDHNRIVRGCYQDGLRSTAAAHGLVGLRLWLLWWRMGKYWGFLPFMPVIIWLHLINGRDGRRSLWWWYYRWRA